MDSAIIIRPCRCEADGTRLRELYTRVFHPEPVDRLAEVFFQHLPGMKHEYWLMAEDQAQDTVCAALALIPWTWEMDGVRLKVAEMGLVGTHPDYRRRGLIKRLNEVFDETLAREAFDLAVIQGIPGFYDNFGYHYAIAMENHLDMPLHGLPPHPAAGSCTFRPAGLDDIAYLMRADADYRADVFVGAYRDEHHWRYLLTHSRDTEYGSDFWIVEHGQRGRLGYFRVPNQGFGQGLIISEVSQGLGVDDLAALLSFCASLARERDKAHIRLNLHNQSDAGRMAIGMGARAGAPYAWQVKIVDPIGLLEKMRPILEARLAGGYHHGFSETLRLDFYTRQVDLVWRSGVLSSIQPGDARECPNTLCIHADLFAALCLGHRSWRELQHTRPDIFPADQYLRLAPHPATDSTGSLVDCLFPKGRSWIYCRY